MTPNMRRAILGLSVAAVVGAVGGGLLLARSADAARVVVIDGSQAKLITWNGQRMVDGGFYLYACGTTTKADGGDAPLDAPCVSCEAQTWNALPAACLTEFKARNTDP